MTLEQIDKIISDLRQQIPTLQMQLNQAEGYKQALMDMEKPEEEEPEPEIKDTT
jgi:prefoldin subunit 5